jgi:hypothetical protein
MSPHFPPLNAPSLLSPLFTNSRPSAISQEIIKKLQNTYHGNRCVVAPAPVHRALGHSHEHLSQLRICPKNASEMPLIRKGRLEPLVDRQTDFAPTKIMLNGEATLVMNLSEQDRIEIFQDLSRAQDVPNQSAYPITMLHLAEVRALQDYMPHTNRWKRWSKQQKKAH